VQSVQCALARGTAVPPRTGRSTHGKPAAQNEDRTAEGMISEDVWQLPDRNLCLRT